MESLSIKDLARPGTQVVLKTKTRPDSAVEVGTKGVITECCFGQISVKFSRGEKTAISSRFTLKEFGLHCEIIQVGPEFPPRKECPSEDIAGWRAQEELGDGIRTLDQMVDDMETYRPVENNSTASSSAETTPSRDITPVWQTQKSAEELELERLSKLDFYFQVGNEKTYWTSTSLYEYGKKNMLPHLNWVLMEDQNKNECVVIQLPPEHAAWKRNGKHVACCAYDGTDSYMKHRLGRSLHSSDRQWYQEHPVTVASGLPAQHTLTVLNDLVKPWGVCISKVWLRKGLIDWPEHAGWKEALGCNGMAVGDNETESHEYVQAMLNSLPETATDEQREAYKLRLETEAAGHRFLYTNILPSEAMVIFDGGYEAKYAGGGGHASFKGPREHKGNQWWMAVQYDLVENVHYHAEPPSTDNMDRGEGNWELDIPECKIADGSKVIRSVMYTSGGSYQGGRGPGGNWNQNFQDGSGSSTSPPIPEAPAKKNTQQRGTGAHTRNGTPTGGGKGGGHSSKSQKRRASTEWTPLASVEDRDKFDSWSRIISGYSIKQLQKFEKEYYLDEHQAVIQELQTLDHHLRISDTLAFLSKHCGSADQPSLGWLDFMFDSDLKETVKEIEEELLEWAAPYDQRLSLVTIWMIEQDTATLFGDRALARWISNLLVGQFDTYSLDIFDSESFGPPLIPDPVDG